MHGYNRCPSGIIVHDRRKHKRSACNLFAPPLPNLDEVIKLPNSRKRRRHNDTEMQCPMFPDGKIGDFSVLRHEWLPIPQKYFHDIQETRDLEKQLHQSVKIGRAAVIAAERDWNTSTPLIVNSWRRSWQLHGLHEARQRAIIVPKAGHSLHPSGENKHLAPLSQQQACQLVVDTGLKILSTSRIGINKKVLQRPINGVSILPKIRSTLAHSSRGNNGVRNQP